MVPRGVLRGEFLIIHDNALEPSSVPMEFMKRPGQHSLSGATALGCSLSLSAPRLAPE